MSACRICLAVRPRRNITELKVSQYDANKNYKDIILFCLGIKVEQDSNASSKLCTKCYKRIILFHDFKALALKNESHWTFPNTDSVLESKIGIPGVIFKTEIESVELDDVIDNGFESETPDDSHEVVVKAECKTEGSDDEFLDVVKNIKYEFVENKEEIETTPIRSKRKKGHPKMVKTSNYKSKQKMKVGPMKICEECGKYVRNLKHHALTHRPKEDRKKYKCEECDKYFSTSNAKYVHNQKKHIVGKRECAICHVKVLDLKLHERLHNPESLPFQCAVCERRFLTKARLSDHLTLHTKDKRFECDICGTKFRIKTSMQLHKRQVHDNEKTHLCQYCSKSFFKKYHLQVHLRTHTKEKPYPCKKCGKCFISSTMLRNHELIHSAQKNFACSLCDMTFVRSGYLVAHMKSHLKEKKFPCQYCDVRFHRSDHRKRHEFTAHLKHNNAAP